MADQEKTDLFRKHKDEYASPKKPVRVFVKKATYLAIDGEGGPGGEIFQAKIGALYAMAYTIKMTRKFGGKRDYVVCKLETQWWHDDGGSDLGDVSKDEWRWKMLIRTPGFVRPAEVAGAAAVLIEKGKGAEVENVKLETLSEGECVQMLHVGPYENEGESVAVMKIFAEKEGLVFHGRHHDIYISDPRRVPPERLKTILRHPVKKKAKS